MDAKHSVVRNIFENKASTVAFERVQRNMAIRTSKLFLGLDPTEYFKVTELARPRSYRRGDVLFSQGEPFRKLILLQSGCVKRTLLNTHGNEVILSLRGAGEAADLPIGVIDGAHSCTCQAVISGSALTWNASEFALLMTQMPQLVRNMYVTLHQHIHELETRYHEIASEPVARRLACTLIRLANQLGAPDGKGTEIRISRQELAQMSGMTLFTVSRLISRWAEAGLVVPRREAILVLNAKRLDDLTSPEVCADRESGTDHR